jgi:hypothetical protein
LEGKMDLSDEISKLDTDLKESIKKFMEDNKKFGIIFPPDVTPESILTTIMRKAIKRDDLK